MGRYRFHLDGSRSRSVSLVLFVGQVRSLFSWTGGMSKYFGILLGRVCDGWELAREGDSVFELLGVSAGITKE